MEEGKTQVTRSGWHWWPYNNICWHPHFTESSLREQPIRNPSSEPQTHSGTLLSLFLIKIRIFPEVLCKKPPPRPPNISSMVRTKPWGHLKRRLYFSTFSNVRNTTLSAGWQLKKSVFRIRSWPLERTIVNYRWWCCLPHIALALHLLNWTAIRWAREAVMGIISMGAQASCPSLNTPVV